MIIIRLVMKQFSEDFFECIEELQRAGESIGMFCGKGGKFNKITGRIRSMSNQELEGKEIAEIDVVAGGQTLLVNAEIVKKEFCRMLVYFFLLKIWT